MAHLKPNLVIYQIVSECVRGLCISHVVPDIKHNTTCLRSNVIPIQTRDLYAMWASGRATENQDRRKNRKN